MPTTQEIMEIVFADWRGVRSQVRTLRLIREDWGAVVECSAWLTRRFPEAIYL